MRASLLLLAVLIAPFASAQTGTFTFSTATANGGGTSVNETVGGATLTITATGPGASSLGVTDYGDWGGTNGNTAYNNTNVSSLILSFDIPVNMASLRFVDGYGDATARTFVFTPSTGTPVIAQDAGGGSGITVAPAGGFVGITSLTITQQDGSDFFFIVDDITMDGSLPVELTRFAATADGADALLHWQTASETNNAGFEIQMDAGAGFAAAGWMPGHGTTLETRTYAFRTDDLAPGSYRFRLKQVDFDGAFQFSPEVELTIAPRGYTLAAPSTFGDNAEVRLSVAHPQHVRVALYDVTGREVHVLHDGAVANSARLTLKGASLPSGVYFVRATGETFAATRQLVHVR